MKRIQEGTEVLCLGWSI